MSGLRGRATLLHVRSRLACVLVVAFFCAVAAPADAYVVGGHRWPGGTITYYVAAKGYSASVGRAARIWSRANVGASFVRTSRAQADVVVTYGGRRCEGASPMGFGGWRELTTMYLGAGCSKSLIVLTAVHEFGHVLGLDHEYAKCARMNPSFSTIGTPTYCAPHSVAYWLRHPLMADDLRGARAIYRTSDTRDGRPDRPVRDRSATPA